MNAIWNLKSFNGYYEVFLVKERYAIDSLTGWLI
jgi:hypothetical protein